MRARPHTTPVVDDAVLLGRVAEGDAIALGALFDRHHRVVYAVLARLRCSNAQIDDLVQEAFLALPKAARRYDPTNSARGFILGVAVTLARQERRNLLRRWRLWQSREHWIDEPARDHDPEQRLGQRQAHEAFERALRTLSHAHREVVILHEVEGLKGDEIARILDVPVNTVWTRLHHARNALRDALDAMEVR